MSEPITPTRTYYTVFAALIALTLLTVGMSFLELGAWHTTVGVLIGVVKASLVGLFFMHLLHSSRASWLAVAGRPVLVGHPHGADAYGLPVAAYPLVLSRGRFRLLRRPVVGQRERHAATLEKSRHIHVLLLGMDIVLARPEGDGGDAVPHQPVGIESAVADA